MRHMLHNLGFGAKYAAAVDKVLKVHIADIGENNVIGTCNCAQSVHFAEVADAHFNNRKLVMRFETEKRLRQSVFVVEIAFRAENAEFLFKHTGKHLPRACFSDAADNADNLHAALFAYVACNALHCAQAVFNKDLRNRNVKFMLHNRCGGTAAPCGFNIIVPVRPLALICDKQPVGFNFAAVEGDALNKHIPDVCGVFTVNKLTVRGGHGFGNCKVNHNAVCCLTFYKMEYIRFP